MWLKGVRYMSGSVIRLAEGISPGSVVTLNGAAFEALLKWQPRIGEALTVAEPGGVLRRARLTGITGTTATLLVFEDIGPAVARLELTLLQALPEKERMELIIQKTTELGVSAIMPFKSAKSTSLEERDSKQKKSARWAAVALKAAKQCRRDSLVELLPYGTLTEALRAAEGSELKLVLSERPGERMLKEVLTGFSQEREKTGPATVRVSVMAGPEGGLAEDELKEAQRAGFVAVSLGLRILRTETAAIVSVALTGYELGG